MSVQPILPAVPGLHLAPQSKQNETLAVHFDKLVAPTLWCVKCVAVVIVQRLLFTVSTGAMWTVAWVGQVALAHDCKTDDAP